MDPIESINLVSKVCETSIKLRCDVDGDTLESVTFRGADFAAQFRFVLLTDQRFIVIEVSDPDGRPVRRVIERVLSFREAATTAVRLEATLPGELRPLTLEQLKAELSGDSMSGGGIVIDR